MLSANSFDSNLSHLCGELLSPLVSTTYSQEFCIAQIVKQYVSEDSCIRIETQHDWNIKLSGTSPTDGRKIGPSIERLHCVCTLPAQQEPFQLPLSASILSMDSVVCYGHNVTHVLKALAAVPHIAYSLKHIYYFYGSLDNFIPLLEPFPNLEHICLSHVEGFDDQLVRWITEQYGSKLQHFEISGTGRVLSAPNQTLIALARSCPELKAINFNCTSIDNEVVMAFVKHCPKLRDVHLKRTEIDNQAVWALLSSNDIERLDIQSCHRIKDGSMDVLASYASFKWYRADTRVFSDPTFTYGYQSCIKTPLKAINPVSKHHLKQLIMPQKTT